jgi:hypothetical protein
MLLNILAKFRPNPQRVLCPQQQDINANLILVFLVISLIFVLLVKTYSIKTVGFTFLERTQYAVSDRNKEDVLGAFLSALSVYVVPFAIACIFSRIPPLLDNKWIMPFSIAIVAMDVGFSLIFGMRSGILFPIVLIVTYLKAYKPKFGWMTKSFIVTLIFILLLVSPILSHSLKFIRGMKSYSTNDILVTSPSKLFSTVGEYSLSALDDIYQKFNSFEHGTTLLEIEGTSRAGMSLITSALTSPIPRMLYPEKPVPFSINGEYSGVPYHLVPSLMGVLAGVVVPIPASTISLWELGYIGLLLMIVFNVVNLLFINFFMKSELLLYRTMGFFMLTMPTYEFLLAPTGWIIKEGLRILALIYLAKLLFLIVRPKRKVLGLQNLTTSQKAFTDRTLR